MRYQLENAMLKVEIDSFGAEIKSVRSKSNDQEYLWHGDPAYWGRTSPVLFPFVGSLKDKTYHYQGSSYPMGQHGFARDMEHHLETQTENAIWFTLTSTEETMAKYPFPFVLKIGYLLEDKTITVCWNVQNTGSTPMHFSIGAHPAFLCPVHGETDKTGYQLYFASLDNVHYHGNDVASGLALDEDLILPLKNSRAEITPGFFDRCTYMIEGNQTTEVGLEDKDGERIVTMHFDTPLFALWSPEGKNAPFICIEPWYGHADYTEVKEDFYHREGTMILSPGKTFTTSYSIEVF